jgi:hypothetical protein
VLPVDTEGACPDHLDLRCSTTDKGDPTTITKKIKNRDQRTETDGEM